MLNTLFIIIAFLTLSCSDDDCVCDGQYENMNTGDIVGVIDVNCNSGAFSSGEAPFENIPNFRYIGCIE